MIFVDANVPMYVVGRDEDLKNRSHVIVAAAIRRGERLVTDAEVMQEILHRYSWINRRQAIQPAFDFLLEVAEQVFAVERRDVELARDILLSTASLSARDAIHAAVMRRHGIKQLLSFDAGFDELADIERITS